MSPDLTAIRAQIVAQCESMGLVEHASRLTMTSSNTLGILRERLREIRLVATGVHSIAVHAAVSASPAAALVHADVATRAMKLEKLAAAAIAVTDRAIMARDAEDALR